ncbi:2'-5' RNA ligase family protein [Clostridium sediminicola]|uniref:2'-5' RNA ligase family protein n=1 Tax=Clostridium sediminicola TaxID=3114879 RepID=UPI0031F1C9EC
MQYYLVALFDEKSYKKVEYLQKQIADKYNLYEKLPTLHMTLEVIDEAEKDKLIPLLDKILKKYSKFTLKINRGICFDPPYKSVNLKVEKDLDTQSLIYDINSSLKANNFKVRENIEDWDLHISLANIYFSKREWETNEFNNACEYIMDMEFDINPTVSEIQLWKPVNNTSEMVLYRKIL